MTYEDSVAQDARLIILRELGSQIDGRLNEVPLQRVLDAFGIRRSRDWVATQMRRMSEVGAVRVEQAGTVLVAALTKHGRDHLERRAIIEGISRPSDED